MIVQNNLPRLVLLIAIMALPFFAYVEHKQNNLWTNRLAIPQIITQPNLHTPAHTDGTYLPPTINKPTTYTANQSPLLLNNTLTITTQGSLTIEPGVIIYANEYAQILNQGHLYINGTAKQPITLATNELNQVNQHWSGIITIAGGVTNIQNASIQDASPGISCMPGSQVTITNSQIIRGNQGVYNQSNNCVVKDTTISK